MVNCFGKRELRLPFFVLLIIHFSLKGIFSDETSQTANLLVNDWYNGTGSAIQGIGSINTSNNNLEGDALNPRLYEIALAIDEENQEKTVTGTTITGFTIPGDYYYEWSTPFCNSTLVVTYSGIDIPTPVVSNVMYCEGADATALTAEILEGYTINWYDSEDSMALTEAPIPDTSVAGTTTYYVSQSNVNGCESPRTAIEVSVIAIPVADIMEDVTGCDVYILPALSENNNYYTGPDATGDMLVAGNELNESQTVYIFAQVPDTECSSESSFDITIISTPLLSVNQGCEGGLYLMEVDIDVNYTEDTVNIDWTDANGAIIGTGLTTATEPGDYVVTVTPIA